MPDHDYIDGSDDSVKEFQDDNNIIIMLHNLNINLRHQLLYYGVRIVWHINIIKLQNVMHLLTMLFCGSKFNASVTMVPFHQGYFNAYSLIPSFSSSSFLVHTLKRLIQLRLSLHVCGAGVRVCKCVCVCVCVCVCRVF